MLSDKPWYDMFPSEFQLKERDFMLSKTEVNDFLLFYRNFVDLFKGDYNHKFIEENFHFIDFLEFDYENEINMDNYVAELLLSSKYIYSSPLVFSNEDFNCILFEFKPSVISKVDSNLQDYNRIFGSMVSDYSGTFLVTPVDFSYVLIVKNGHYVLRFHRKKHIYKNRWMDLSLGKIEMYEYDIKELSKFYNNIS